ncbi:MAG: hypothetical protein L6R37_004503 [Teloschistes peruensis]|nr:MAG: hypothetical protein L6R37_004503 [Teloschistes peruensis]
MDGYHRDEYDEHREQCEAGKRHDLWEYRYEHSLVRLLEYPELPSLSSPSGFTICLSWPTRNVEPKSALLLAKKLSNVRSITLDLSDNEKEYPHIRQQSRYDPPNQYSSPPSALLPSEPSTDHLSHALYALSQSSTLTSLILKPIFISPELYWPANSPSTPPAWHRIQHYHVEFGLSTPDGDWYFIRDPSTPIDDEEGFADRDDGEYEEDDDTDSDPVS